MGSEDVYKRQEYGQKLLEYYDSLEEQNPQKATFFSRNIPPYPDYLDAFLTQNLVSQNLSLELLTDLNEYVINLKRTRQHMVPFYLQLLNLLREMIKQEIRYQQGEISPEQLQLNFEHIQSQLVNSKSLIH